MSNQINSRWVWSPAHELSCVLGACKNITNGFFELNHFFALPDNSTYHGGNTVSLPHQLPFTQISSFWDRVSQVDLSCIPYRVPPDLKNELLPMFLTLPPLDYLALQSLWKSHQADILRLASEQLGVAFSQYRLSIYPVRFGTIGSFNLSTNSHISVFWRADQSLHTLVEIILSSVLRPQHNQLALSWSESEAVIDHLMTVSPLARFLNRLSAAPYQGTLAPLKRESPRKLVQASQKFLRLIGAPIVAPRLTIVNGVPHCHNLPLHGLTDRETKILVTLIDKAPRAISYDQLADLIFASDDEYSLAVLSKVIDRLRDKLERNGLTRSYLATERSVGYFLNT